MGNKIMTKQITLPNSVNTFCVIFSDNRGAGSNQIHAGLGGKLSPAYNYLIENPYLKWPCLIVESVK